jgi:integrating conjugative element protein (TIGR03765 family)
MADRLGTRSRSVLCRLFVSAALQAAWPAAKAADAGPTLPIQQFLAERLPATEQSQLVSDYAVDYPVRTAGLVRARLRKQVRFPARLPDSYTPWLTQPMALIGDDAASRAWLTQQGDALLAMGASVLVVRVPNVGRMRALREVRPDLPMAPAAVPELAGALRQAGAAVYPLVILPDGSLTQDVRDRAPIVHGDTP